jgi:hypothetical protein
MKEEEYVISYCGTYVLVYELHPQPTGCTEVWFPTTRTTSINILNEA